MDWDRESGEDEAEALQFPEEARGESSLHEEEDVVWGEGLSQEKRSSLEKKLLAQMFLRFGEWPLLEPEEERRLLALYLTSRKELPLLAEFLGITSEEVARGIRAKALEAMGLGLGEEGISPKAFSKNLWRAYQAVYEGEQARARLILSNARLVVSLAKGYAAKWPSVPLEDLIQEGFYGLFKAIDRFDLRQRSKLSTYASWWIRDALNKGVRKHIFAQRLSPAEGEESHLVSVLSIDEAINDEGDRYADLIPDRETPSMEEVESQEEAERFMKEILQKLPPRDGFVLISRYGLFGFRSHSYAELAQKLGISEVRVRQIEAKAIKRLSTLIGQSEGAFLPSFLGAKNLEEVEEVEEEDDGDEEA